jgi:hypothetical protein
MTYGGVIKFAATPNLLRLFIVLNLILIKFNIRRFIEDRRKFREKHSEFEIYVLFPVHLA